MLPKWKIVSKIPKISAIWKQNKGVALIQLDRDAQTYEAADDLLARSMLFKLCVFFLPVTLLLFWKAFSLLISKYIWVVQKLFQKLPSSFSVEETYEVICAKFRAWFRASTQNAWWKPESVEKIIHFVFKDSFKTWGSSSRQNLLEPRLRLST